MKTGGKLKNYILFFIGAVGTALSISVFFLPNKIVTGGVSGISTIMYHAMKVPPGLTYFVINAVLLVFGFIFLGRGFVIKSTIGAGIVTVLVEVFAHLPTLTEDIILNVSIGSILYGISIGLTLISGGSTGGTDILGRLIQYKFPHFGIGTAMWICDFAVIAVSLVLFREIDLALYGIISLFVSTAAINFLIKWLNVSKLAFIITEKGAEMSKMLVSTSPRGVTVIDVVGGYTGEEKMMLMCALKENELPPFQKKVLAIDNNAFIIFSESEQIVGNGFYVYK